MRRTRRAAAVLAFLLIPAACATATRDKVLSFFFDGVPPRVAAGEGAQAAAEVSEGGPGAQAPERLVEGAPILPGTKKGEAAAEIDPGLREIKGIPGPPIESLHAWEEVLRLLPGDQAGGVDWVAAVKQGVILPRLSPDPRKPPGPPFTLDTILPGIASRNQPPFDLDIELIPDDAPFFKVRFPHSSHTLWLNCSSCHPGAAAKRAPMEKILRGAYCGECHGKVAFDPATGGCARCHVNLVPADEESIDADVRRAETEPIPSAPEELARGRALYLGKCAICHGDSGDGKGPLAALVDPRPRDFTAGKYKFRSTPSTSVPTDADLFRIITRGVSGTSMPAWSTLSYEDRWSLVHFIKGFSGRFAKQEPAEPVPIPEMPPGTPELLEQGKTMYKEAGCNSCHGDEGRGDGESAPGLTNDWGEPLRPFDFTSGRSPKRGDAPQDYYRTIMTGLAGAPMPDFGEIFEPEQAWSVVQHLLSLRTESAGAAFGIKGEIQFARETPPDGVPAASFPHWSHRIRFKCAACHPNIFEMKAGANPMTMDDMKEGRLCAECHDGKVAWEIGFPTCVRCHVAR